MIGWGSMPAASYPVPGLPLFDGSALGRDGSPSRPPRRTLPPYLPLHVWGQSSGRATNPARTGFSRIYWALAANSASFLSRWSKKSRCQTTPCLLASQRFRPMTSRARPRAWLQRATICKDSDQGETGDRMISWGVMPEASYPVPGLPLIEGATDKQARISDPTDRAASSETPPYPRQRTALNGKPETG